VDLLVNGKPIARGEVMAIDEEFGLRVTEIVSPLPTLAAAADAGALEAPVPVLDAEPEAA
jgi:flagellar motor switch protein FliN/FliY